MRGLDMDRHDDDPSHPVSAAARRAVWDFTVALERRAIVEARGAGWLM